MSEIVFDGLNSVLGRIESIGDEEKVKRALKEACARVERDAKINASKFRGDGTLSGSISSEVNGLVGKVYTNLEYAPYVEYGTGLYREVNPQAGYWVYVKDGATNNGTKAESSKRYTLEEAKKIVAIMKSKGLDATYTQGREATPYLRPALYKNKQKIVKLIGDSLKDD